MFEPGEPWYVLNPSEIHAFGYGLLDGIKIWQRKPVIEFDKIDSLPISPEWKADLKLKYHYYYVGYEIPEALSFVLVVAYIAITDFPILVKMVMPNFGV